MCELFAMSSRIETTVSFSLHELSRHGGLTGSNDDGWGVATYEENTAFVYREPRPAAFSRRLQFIQAHPRPSKCVISHIRRATVGEIALRNTQPFQRIYNGRSHVFAHNGDLQGIENKPLSTDCDYLYAFANKRRQASGRVEPPGMHFLARRCQCDHDALRRVGVDIGCEPQQVCLLASVPLTDEDWQPLPSEELIVVRDGEIERGFE